jgi:hypothetical protein
MAVLTARNMVEAYEGQKDIHPFFGKSASMCQDSQLLSRSYRVSIED